MADFERPELQNPNLEVLEAGPMPLQEYLKYSLLKNFYWQGHQLYGKWGNSVEEVCGGGGIPGFYEKARVIDWDYDIGEMCYGQRVAMAKVR